MQQGMYTKDTRKAVREGTAKHAANCSSLITSAEAINYCKFSGSRSMTGDTYALA